MCLKLGHIFGAELFLSQLHALQKKTDLKNENNLSKINKKQKYWKTPIQNTHEIFWMKQKKLHTRPPYKLWFQKFFLSKSWILIIIILFMNVLVVS